MATSCVPARLCPNCRDDEYRYRKPTAERRGAAWAESVARRQPYLVKNEPWPMYNEPKVRPIARAKVADLSLDGRVCDQLSIACWQAAYAWWLQARARVGVSTERIAQQHGRASRNV
jgi:hypothetical protein